MASVNKVILLGHLGKDPEVRYLPNGDAVANVSIATSEAWNDKASGEKKEATEWHRVVFYGRLAEIAGEYLRKGAPVYVEGKLTTRKWEDKDGQTRYTTEVRASEMKMLGKKQDGEREPEGQPAPKSENKPAPARGGAIEDMDSDIPF